MSWDAPGPLIIVFEAMFGRTDARLIVPVTENSITSSALLLPAAHSPAPVPEATLLFAAVIASRKVHKPSLPFATSERLLTVMVLPCGVITPLSARNDPVETLRRAA